MFGRDNFFSQILTNFSTTMGVIRGQFSATRPFQNLVETRLQRRDGVPQPAPAGVFQWGPISLAGRIISTNQQLLNMAKAKTASSAFNFPR